MTLGTLNISTVSGLIALVKAGDGPSLGCLRELLGLTSSEVAAAVGASEAKLSQWELGIEAPTSGQMAKWRLRFSRDIDTQISRFLGTDNPGVLHDFWELAWRLG